MTAEALIRDWLGGRQSAHTRRAYAKDLSDWLDWCARHETDPLGAAEPIFEAWARWLEASGLAASTVARKVSAISSWYIWLARNSYPVHNPAGLGIRPVVDRGISTTAELTRDQALAMIAAADCDFGRERLRTAALLAVLLYTGARIGEVLAADVSDLGIDRGHRVLRVARQSGLRQSLAIRGPAAVRLDAYLASRNDIEEGQSPPLFATSSGHRLDRQYTFLLVRRIGKAAGLPGDLVAQLGPHVLRNAFVVLSLDTSRMLRSAHDAASLADPPLGLPS